MIEVIAERGTDAGSVPPRVSVCIPTLNGAPFLRECLASVARQDYPAAQCEVIVCDNGSHDGSVDVALESLASVPFGRVVVAMNPRRGIGANWNAALGLATCDFCLLLMQDDLLAEDAVSTLLRPLENDASLSFSFGRRQILVSQPVEGIDEWMRTCGDLQAGIVDVLTTGRLTADALFAHPALLHSPQNKIGEPSFVMFRRHCAEAAGGFREDLVQTLDYEFWYRLLTFGDAVFVDREVGAFRRHPGQATEQNKTVWDQEVFRRDLCLWQVVGPRLSRQNRRALATRIGRAAFRRAANRAKRWFVPRPTEPAVR